ncbi:MAG: TetR/AcrR family transcriptional regulator C-terminal domain-containing protein [Stackebrandtia sp.]
MRGKQAGGRNGSVWLRSRRTDREDPITLERIAEAAVALLDAEGIRKLTMRRLAERLDVVAASLYWHVDTKDDVIDLAVDAIFGSVAPLEHTADWRVRVAAIANGWRSVLLHHPWAATASARQRSPIGPNFLTQMEILQSALVDAGFTGKRLPAATWVLYNHVVGSASTQSVLELDEDERRAGQELLSADGEYPTLAANGYLYDDDWDGNFAAGLEFVLDGLQAQLNAAPPPR